MSYEGKWWMNMKKRHREVSYWLCCCRCISYASVSSIARVVVQWCTFSIMHQPQIFLCLIGFCGRLKQLLCRLFKFLGLRITWIEQELLERLTIVQANTFLLSLRSLALDSLKKKTKNSKSVFCYCLSRQIRQFTHITKRCHITFLVDFS